MRLLALSTLVLAAALHAQGEPPAPGVFPADRDGAPAPLVPVDAPRPEGERGPRREPGRLLRDKVAQLKEAGITREDMQKIKAALETARDDESVKAARKVADEAHEKLRAALRTYAESKGIQPPDRPEARKSGADAGKDKPDPSPEQLAERRARRAQEFAQRKAEISPEKMAEVRKVMEGARNDPAVKSAFEESKAAGDALRAAVKAAVLKADPSLAPLVEKLGDLREVFRDEHPGPGFGQKREGGRGGEGRPRGDKPAEAPAKTTGA